MKVSDFDYELPEDRIAQVPAGRRDASRLLVHQRAADRTRHASFAELPELLREGDLLVVNDTRVLPARLFGRRASGGRVEFLFCEPLPNGSWRAMVNPARKLHAGEVVRAAGGEIELHIGERELEESGKPSPYWEVALTGRDGAPVDPTALLEGHGNVPLPPYIHREGGEVPEDAERYQTVYARVAGAIAAPTAGLHFTDEVLAELDRRGVDRATLTLHVGPGTFRPVDVEDTSEHRMHSERFHLPAETVERIAACRRRGGRVVAVGTTCVRVLESRARADGSLEAGEGRTELFITPGFPFRVVDVLLTNFHLPKSTLLMLVAAFVGRERILRLYEEAIAEEYRFYSYGDAMLLCP